MGTQRANERTAWGRIWRKMSLASQSRVREEEDFEEVYMTLDNLKLWECDGRRPRRGSNPELELQERSCANQEAIGSLW